MSNMTKCSQILDCTNESTDISTYHVNVDGDEFDVEAESLASVVKQIKDKYQKPDRVSVEKIAKFSSTPLIDTKYGDTYDLLK